MSFFGNFFGKKTESPAIMPFTESENIQRLIESTEGELHEASVRLAHATDPAIKESLEFLVSRKTQAVADLQEKLVAARARETK